MIKTFAETNFGDVGKLNAVGCMRENSWDKNE